MAEIRLGLIGENIAASQAPRLHLLAGALYGIDVRYDLLVPSEIDLEFSMPTYVGNIRQHARGIGWRRHPSKSWCWAIGNVDPRVLGTRHACLMLMNVDQRQLPQVVKVLQSLPEITQLAALTGRNNLFAIISATERTRFQEILDEHVGTHAGIAEFEMIDLVNSYKFDGSWSIPRGLTMQLGPDSNHSGMAPSPTNTVTTSR